MPPGAEMQGKGRAGDHHEDDDHPLGIRGEPGQRISLRPEAAGRHRGHGVSHCLEQAHVSDREQHDQHAGETDIQPPEALRRVPEARRHPIGLRAGRFGSGQLDTTCAQHREYRYR
jgi:hypothetical protein